MAGFGKLPGQRSGTRRDASRLSCSGAARPQASPSDAVLTSRDNRWLKDFRMALRGGLPTASGCVGVEGARLVEEALQSGCRIEAVLFSESGERFREHFAPFLTKSDLAFPVLRTTDRLFEGLADTEHPQGVAALVQPRATALDDLLETPASGSSLLLAILAGVQDPGNVGAILRTAAAFGATGAITAATTCSGTANPYAPKALRASAGAALHLPVLPGMSLPILLAQLKVRGVRILASSLHPSTGPASESDPRVLAPWDIDWCEPSALLVGNEGTGLPEEVERSADLCIRIPISGGIESLNAAAAAAVLFYEAARQRNSLTPRAVQPRQDQQNPKPIEGPGIEPFRLT